MRTEILIAAPLLVALSSAAASSAKIFKYYFRVTDINMPPSMDSSMDAVARDLLTRELASRPDFTDEAAGAEEIKRRGLKGYKVSLTIDRLAQEMKPPRPGGRLKQLTMDVKLTVLGVLLPGEKLAFSGDGAATIEAEVAERRMLEEAASMTKEALAAALKQAVDQALAKLGAPKAAPMNESRRRKRR